MGPHRRESRFHICADDERLLTIDSYLIQEEYIQVPEVEWNLALLCLRFLTFECFDSGLSQDDIREFIADGYYAFQDYAVLHWLDHVEFFCQSLKSEIDQNFEPLALAVKNFSSRRGNSANLGDGTIQLTPNHGTDDDRLETISQLITEIKEIRLQDETLTALGALGDTVSDIRSLLEEYADTASIDLDIVGNSELYYGLKSFKCPKHPCFYFHEGFSSAKLRNQHVERHENPFCCTEPGCPRLQIGFVSEKELKKHMSTTHPDPEALSSKFFKVKEKKPTKFFNAINVHAALLERIICEAIFEVILVSARSSVPFAQRSLFISMIARGTSVYIEGKKIMSAVVS